MFEFLCISMPLGRKKRKATTGKGSQDRDKSPERETTNVPESQEL